MIVPMKIDGFILQLILVQHENILLEKLVAASYDDVVKRARQRGASQISF